MTRTSSWIALRNPTFGKLWFATVVSGICVSAHEMAVTWWATVTKGNDEEVLITGATGATGKNAIKKLLELKVPVRVLVHKTDARSATRWKQFRHCLYCQFSDGYPGKSRDKLTKLSA